MANSITMITGGQRSGKSMHAEQLALSLSDRPVYVATAEVLDDEMRDRVDRHQKRRGAQWTTIEEPLHPSRHDLRGRTVLLDCATLLSTNHFFAVGEDVDKALASVRDELDRLFAQDATLIIVTNEIGMGGVSANQMMRRFTDLLGLVNKYIAQRADTVTLMVSGIPMKIK